MTDDLTTRAREVAEGMLILCQNAERRPVSYSDMAKCAANSDGTCDCSRQVGIIAAFARTEIERAKNEDGEKWAIWYASHSQIGAALTAMTAERDEACELASGHQKYIDIIQEARERDAASSAAEITTLNTQLAAARKAMEKAEQWIAERWVGGDFQGARMHGALVELRAALASIKPEPQL